MTIFDFTANKDEPKEFTAQFDGVDYLLVLKYRFFLAQTYFDIFDQLNNLVCSRPLVDSRRDKPINLLGGVFKSTMHYFPNGGLFIDEIL